MLYGNEGLTVVSQALKQYRGSTSHDNFIANQLITHIGKLQQHMDDQEIHTEDVETIIMAIEDLSMHYEDIEWEESARLVDCFSYILYESGLMS